MNNKLTATDAAIRRLYNSSLDVFFFSPPRGEYKHLHHCLFGEAINRFDEQTEEETEDNLCTLSQFSFGLKGKTHLCLCYVVYIRVIHTDIMVRSIMQ